MTTEELQAELEENRKWFANYKKQEAERELKEVNKKIAELEAKDADRIKEEREKKEDADMIAAFDKAWNS
ncbi:hypothetical protein CUC43_34300 (plasmid) [Bacillus thuringiensis LM1212]|uniref:hypothetical protein n=1 Tax=Bacillus cereus group TaxID=86661 RepID=UPI0004103439|nr:MULTISPECIES: hypothetical protein [Bacillus cereus group]AXY11624.1 hypothetical protein CUC43_34300 [Bacillus thuringiensis LM1212]QDF27461.1 hypothetical protein FJR70_32560 [Bacillus tropicus]QDF27476.1 hypothetical protein FJR70_32645 [Bacillus tropicus]QUG99353.1 hypothetical protein HCM98_31580 [Bacillus tropicus]